MRQLREAVEKAAQRMPEEQQRLWAAPATPTLSAQPCCADFEFSFHNWVKLGNFVIKSSSPVSHSELKFLRSFS